MNLGEEQAAMRERHQRKGRKRKAQPKSDPSTKAAAVRDTSVGGDGQIFPSRVLAAEVTDVN
jgi:hypothetical protein